MTHAANIFPNDTQAFVINIMVVDGLATQGPRELAATLQIWFSRNIPQSRSKIAMKSQNYHNAKKALTINEWPFPI